MKNKIIIAALACVVSLFVACSGDHTSQNGKDTVNNTYKVAKDTSKMDTGKATSSDNSASGGSDLMKDTSKKGKSAK
jgi:hypothetical protein